MQWRKLCWCAWFIGVMFRRREKVGVGRFLSVVLNDWTSVLVTRTLVDHSDDEEEICRAHDFSAVAPHRRRRSTTVQGWVSDLAFIRGHDADRANRAWPAPQVKRHPAPGGQAPAHRALHPVLRSRRGGHRAGRSEGRALPARCSRDRGGAKTTTPGRDYR